MIKVRTIPKSTLVKAALVLAIMGASCALLIARNHVLIPVTNGYVHAFLEGMLVLLCSAMLLVPLEMHFSYARPAGEAAPRLTRTLLLKKYGKGVFFWAAHNFMVLLAPLVIMPFVISELHLHPFIVLDTEQWTHSPVLRETANLTLLIGSFFVFDFMFYWFHRLQHKWPVLWRFHSVHHSINELNCVNNFQHVTEEYLRIFFIYLPLTVVQFKTHDILIVSAVLTLWGSYNHSQIRFSFGKLNRYLVDNQIHRIHHSLQTKHYDKNFAFWFCFIDRMFGTYCPPVNADEFPAVGISNFREPQNLKEYILALQPIETATKAIEEETSAATGTIIDIAA